MRKRVAVSAVLGLMLALAPPALAQEADESNGVLLIMDASGSMGRVDDQGIRLIDGAKDALDTLVDAMPEGAPIGLRVYGHRIPNTDKANGCTDTELVVPVGPLRRDEMHAAIASVDASGFTPIGLSLQAAAEDLGGAGTIVLVSDGEDTCAPPDPCEIAAELRDAGFDLRVETIGFFLEDAVAREQLQCIAAATGGDYRDVGDLEVLATEVGVLIGQSIPEVGRFHLPLQGGQTVSTATSAPLRAPFEAGPETAFEGAYESTLEPGITRWFSVDAAAGVGVSVYGAHFGTTGAAARGTVEITLLDRDGNDAIRRSPRRGVAVADLERFTGPDGVSLNAVNHTDFHPWGQLDPDELPPLANLGYDEERYNEEWLTAMLAPLEDPPPPGPYAIGFTWNSDQEGEQLQFGWGLSITAQPVDRYGQVYERLDGGSKAASAVAFTAAGDAVGVDPNRFPPGEYTPVYRSFHVGAVTSGVTSWYFQELEFDEAWVVEALVVDTDDGPAEDGSLQLEIFDRDMMPVGHAVPVTPAFDPSGTGILTAMSMVHDGDGDPPPSSDHGAWLAVTWTSPSGESADVRMIVDVTARYPDSPAPNPIPLEPEPPEEEEEAAAETAEDRDLPAQDREEPGRSEQSPSGGSNGQSGLLIAAILAALATSAFVIVRSLRRRRDGADDRL